MRADSCGAATLERPYSSLRAFDIFATSKARLAGFSGSGTVAACSLILATHRRDPFAEQQLRNGEPAEFTGSAHPLDVIDGPVTATTRRLDRGGTAGLQRLDEEPGRGWGRDPGARGNGPHLWRAMPGKARTNRLSSQEGGVSSACAAGREPTIPGKEKGENRSSPPSVGLPVEMGFVF